MLNSLDKLLIQEMDQEDLQELTLEETDEEIFDRLNESEEENDFGLTDKLFQ